MLFKILVALCCLLTFVASAPQRQPNLGQQGGAGLKIGQGHGQTQGQGQTPGYQGFLDLIKDLIPEMPQSKIVTSTRAPTSSVKVVTTSTKKTSTSSVTVVPSSTKKTSTSSITVVLSSTKKTSTSSVEGSSHSSSSTKTLTSSTKTIVSSSSSSKKSTSTLTATKPSTSSTAAQFSESKSATSSSTILSTASALTKASSTSSYSSHSSSASSFVSGSGTSLALSATSSKVPSSSSRSHGTSSSVSSGSSSVTSSGSGTISSSPSSASSSSGYYTSKTATLLSPSGSSSTTTLSDSSASSSSASSASSSSASSASSSSASSASSSSASSVSSSSASSASSSSASSVSSSSTSSVSSSSASSVSSSATSSAASTSSSVTSTSTVSVYSSTSSTTSSASATSTVCAGNDANNRTVWCDYDISTNYYDESPDTGVTVEYWFELTNITAAPNGIERTVLAVNGSIPGPTIEANWGDNVVVHVTNSLENNGSSIHFHGIRQNYTNPNDGVASITQCPIAPGESMTYSWKATQYGSSWYHSHYAMQAWDGVLGGIVIHGPATANYDYDLGSLFLNDWDERTADQLYLAADTGGPPTQTTGLINGTNVYYDDDSVGTRFSTSWVSGSSYLLRVVNGAIDTHFSFTIDNHTLQVVASDFVPIVPYTTDVVSIGMGQRYDIIVTADQADVASDFWLRAVPDTYCSNNANPDDIKGIVHYGDSTGTPTTSSWTITENDCNSEPSASIVPYVSLDASTDTTVSLDDVATIGFSTSVKWYLGDVSMVVNWTDPTSLMVLNNDTTFESSDAVVEISVANSWTQLVIESTFAQAHPIHLHGHDFFTLASGTGTYANAAPTLNTSNPPRRDVDMLPASGYLVIAFKADNPGVWLAHCHIGWHTGEGFALQFVERYDEIAAMYNQTTVENTCSAWESYLDGSGKVQDDSGI